MKIIFKKMSKNTIEKVLFFLKKKKECLEHFKIIDLKQNL